MAPFHWTDCRRPELVCVRPAGRGDSPSIYNWSGGFDPLTIGAVPLRIKKQHSYHSASDNKPFTVRSIKMEADVRKKTGGTGINLSFEEENPSGDGALFRIENRSAFPVWISQDGMIANPSAGVKDISDLEGYLMKPNEKSCFALEGKTCYGLTFRRRSRVL